MMFAVPENVGIYYLPAANTALWHLKMKKDLKSDCNCQWRCVEQGVSRKLQLSDLSEHLCGL